MVLAWINHGYPAHGRKTTVLDWAMTSYAIRQPQPVGCVRTDLPWRAVISSKYSVVTTRCAKGSAFHREPTFREIRGYMA